jgi:hypothetical protein
VVHTIALLKTGNVVQSDNVAHSCDHCCSGKAIKITYSEFVFVAFGIRHAMRVRRVVIFGLPGFAIFFHINSLKARFLDKSY